MGAKVGGEKEAEKGTIRNEEGEAQKKNGRQLASSQLCINLKFPEKIGRKYN